MVLQCEVSRGREMKRVSHWDHVGRQERGTGSRGERPFLLDLEFCALLTGIGSALTVRLDQALRLTHRQHPKKGRFARILKPDHRHIHFGCPAWGLAPPLDGLDGMRLGTKNPATWSRRGGPSTTHQKVLSNQSYSRRNTPAMLAKAFGFVATEV